MMHPFKFPGNICSPSELQLEYSTFLLFRGKRKIGNLPIKPDMRVRARCLAQYQIAEG